MKFLGRHEFPGSVRINKGSAQELSIAGELNIPRRPPLDETPGDLYARWKNLYLVDDQTRSLRVPNIEDPELIFPIIISHETLLTYFNSGELTHLESFSEGFLHTIFPLDYTGPCRIQGGDVTIFPDDPLSFQSLLDEYSSTVIPVSTRSPSGERRLLITRVLRSIATVDDLTFSAETIPDLSEVLDSTEISIFGSSVVGAPKGPAPWRGPSHTHHLGDIEDLTTNRPGGLVRLDHSGFIRVPGIWGLKDPTIVYGSMMIPPRGPDWKGCFLFTRNPNQLDLTIVTHSEGTNTIYDYMVVTIPLNYGLTNGILGKREETDVTFTEMSFSFEKTEELVVPYEGEPYIRFVNDDRTDPTIIDTTLLFPYARHRVRLYQADPASPIVVLDQESVYFNLYDNQMVIPRARELDITDEAFIHETNQFNLKADTTFTVYEIDPLSGENQIYTGIPDLLLPPGTYKIQGSGRVRVELR